MPSIFNLVMVLYSCSAAEVENHAIDGIGRLRAQLPIVFYSWLSNFI